MKKLGRNEPCHCGSGKKYKKCCLGKTTPSTESTQKSVSSNTLTRGTQNTQGLLTTTTGELHMPVRLYYKVDAKAQLIDALDQLRCIEEVAEDRWKLTYDEEAKEFGLSIKYNETTQSLSSIVIGYMHLANDELLHIDVRSFQRAARMIEFIDRHINRQIAKITHAASYTKVMTITKENIAAMSGSKLDHLFMPENIEEINPESLPEELKDITDELKAAAKQGAFSFKLANDEERQPLIEKFPVNYYEEGITPFESSLRITEMLAIKHHQEDKAHSTHDAVIDGEKEVAQKFQKEINAEQAESVQSEENNMPTETKQSKSKPTCGLCGSSSKRLTKTDCCDNWICDDGYDYVALAYAKTGCYRNHERYTLCVYHYNNEDHSGRWQDCKKCKDDFSLPSYIDMSTNEHNFEELEDPERVIIKCANCDFTGDKDNDFIYETSKGYYCAKPQCQEAAFEMDNI